MSQNQQLEIVLFTNSFPYNFQYTEIPFLKTEVDLLAKSTNLTIVPLKNEGDVLGINKKIKINESLSLKLKDSKKLSLLTRIYNVFRYKYFIDEVFSCRSLLQLYNLLLNTAQIITIYKWAQNFFKNFNKDKPIILYTYWCTNVTLALAYFIEKSESNYKLISRAHGADLYLERNRFNPYYKLRLRQLDALILVSEAGKKYLTKKFPEFQNKYFVSYLGTEKENKSVKIKINGKTTIVSCSTINTIKRVDHIFESIFLFAKKHKILKVEWVHFGGGPLEARIRKSVIEGALQNLIVKLTGTISNEGIHEYYKNNFVDCFVHASSSEGGIVLAIAEAQSYGIPVIATNVGGIPEIVNNNNGILVNYNADVNVIANAIEKIVLNKDLRERLGNNALKNWEANFEAKKNYSKFLNILYNL